MKRRLIVISALMVILLGIWHSLDVRSVEKQVEHHLSLGGYESSEYSIEISYHWENKLLGYNPYTVRVVYVDEPKVDYYYDYRRGKAIIQSGIARAKGTVSDSENKDFKHLE
jgi:hypothetical protein